MTSEEPEREQRRLGSVLGASRGDSGGPGTLQDGVLDAPMPKVLLGWRERRGPWKSSTSNLTDICIYCRHL